MPLDCKPSAHSAANPAIYALSGNIFDYEGPIRKVGQLVVGVP